VLYARNKTGQGIAHSWLHILGSGNKIAYTINIKSENYMAGCFNEGGYL